MALHFPNIDPVALSFGPLVIRWYALSYLVGIVLGWRYCLKYSKDPGSSPDAQSVDDFLTWAVLGIIIGGRLGYVFFYQPLLFLEKPLDIFMVWKGGMSFHGGMVGVLTAMVIFSKRRAIPLLNLTDIICSAAPIGLFFGRLANFINGELYGRHTKLPWGVVFPDGSNLPRHPSQIYEAVLEGLVLFVILHIMIRTPRLRKKRGLISGSFLIGYGLFRSLVEFVREPDEQLGFIGGIITMGQVLCIPMIVAGIALIIFSNTKSSLDRVINNGNTARENN